MGGSAKGSAGSRKQAAGWGRKGEGEKGEGGNEGMGGKGKGEEGSGKRERDEESGRKGTKGDTREG